MKAIPFFLTKSKYIVSYNYAIPSEEIFFRRNSVIRINLSRLLGEKKWTQADLARKTGIRPNTICAMYNEYIDRVSINQLEKICEVLECDIHELLEYIPKASNTRKK